MPHRVSPGRTTCQRGRPAPEEVEGQRAVTARTRRATAASAPRRRRTKTAWDANMCSMLGRTRVRVKQLGANNPGMPHAGQTFAKARKYLSTISAALVAAERAG